MSLRDRIVELRRVPAAELTANPENWRMHPESQRGALQAMLSDVGFVGAIIARETDKGELVILDGHLRADVADDEEVPVLVTDLDEDEARKVLLTYDPLSAMAEADKHMLRELMDKTELDDHADLRKFQADMEKATEVKEKPKDEHEVLGMPLRPHEHYDYLVVLASTTHDWNTLCDRLGLVPEKRKGGMGTCRAIRAEKLLEALDPPQPERPKRKRAR